MTSGPDSSPNHCHPKAMLIKSQSRSGPHPLLTQPETLLLCGELGRLLDLHAGNPDNGRFLLSPKSLLCSACSWSKTSLGKRSLFCFRGSIGREDKSAGSGGSVLGSNLGCITYLPCELGHVISHSCAQVFTQDIEKEAEKGKRDYSKYLIPPDTNSCVETPPPT